MEDARPHAGGRRHPSAPGSSRGHRARPGEHDFGWPTSLLDLLHENGIRADLHLDRVNGLAWFFAARRRARKGHRRQSSSASAQAAWPPYPPGLLTAAVSTLTRSHAGAQPPGRRAWHVHNEYGAPSPRSTSWPDRVPQPGCRTAPARLDAQTAGQYCVLGPAAERGRDVSDVPAVAPSVVNPAQRCLDFARFSDSGPARVLRRGARRDPRALRHPRHHELHDDQLPAGRPWSWADEVSTSSPATTTSTPWTKVPRGPRSPPTSRARSHAASRGSSWSTHVGRELAAAQRRQATR